MSSTFTKQSERGNAILEFAIVLPLIFMLVLGTVEFSKLFKIKEFQTMVTREAATIAFRECFERGERECVTQDFLNEAGLDTETRMQACLEQWNDDIERAIGDSGILDGVSLTISFHLMEEEEEEEGEESGAPGVRPITLLGSTTRNTPRPGADDSEILPTRSRYVNQATTDAVRRDFGAMLETNGLIVIAESFVDFPFIFSDIFSPESGESILELYNATAY